MENGQKNGKGKIWSDGPEKRAVEENSTGLSPGTGKSKLSPRKRMKRATNSQWTHPMDQRSKNQIARNGEGMRKQARSGTRNGAKITEMAKRKNGATSGRSIWPQAAEKAKTGAKHTTMTGQSGDIGPRNGTTGTLKTMESTREGMKNTRERRKRKNKLN